MKLFDIKHIFVLSALICTCFFSNAQKPTFTLDKYPVFKYMGLTGSVYFNTYIQIKGSPFLNEGWLQGKLFLKNGDTLSDIKIRFDIYKHQVQVYQEYLKSIILVDKDQVNGFSVLFDGKYHLFIKEMNLKGKTMTDGGCFLEALSTGNVALKKLYFDDIVQYSSSVKKYIGEFVSYKEYKLRVGSDLKNIRLKKSSLKKIFPRYKSQITHYVRNENLRASREADFTKLVIYIDSLYSADSQKISGEGIK